ncbi:unnamed protein product [Brassicogethes aeneus]|nr:unnamed protein product [Brassicogethes aeneus]
MFLSCGKQKNDTRDISTNAKIMGQPAVGNYVTIALENGQYLAVRIMDISENLDYLNSKIDCYRIIPDSFLFNEDSTSRDSFSSEQSDCDVCTNEAQCKKPLSSSGESEGEKKPRETFVLSDVEEDSLGSSSLEEKENTIKAKKVGVSRKMQFPEEVIKGKDTVVVGPNGSRILRKNYESIDFKNYNKATRKLLSYFFPRDILASSSLSGRPSPAFLDVKKPLKQKLNPVIVADIIDCVRKKSNVPEKMVRQVITTKCADECKLKNNKKQKRR